MKLVLATVFVILLACANSLPLFQVMKLESDPTFYHIEDALHLDEIFIEELTTIRPTPTHQELFEGNVDDSFKEFSSTTLEPTQLYDQTETSTETSTEIITSQEYEEVITDDVEASEEEFKVEKTEVATNLFSTYEAPETEIEDAPSHFEMTEAVKNLEEAWKWIVSTAKAAVNWAARAFISLPPIFELF